MLKTAYKVLPCSAVQKLFRHGTTCICPIQAQPCMISEAAAPHSEEPTGYMRLPAYKEKLAVSVLCEVIAWHVHMPQDYSRLGIYPCQAYMPILHAFARRLRSPTITL